jgi:hypothetical protein
MADARGYRFEPLQRRGLLLGLGAGQLAVVAVSMVAGLVFITSWPGLVGFSAAFASLALAGFVCRPVGGHPPLEWFALGASYLSRRRSDMTAPPGREPSRVEMRLPARTFAAGTYLAELPAQGDQGAIGVVVDERSGSVAALLRAKGGEFCLLDGLDKERKLAAWAAVLESVSSQRSSVVRLQWCQRSIPADSAPLIAYLKRAGGPGNPGYRGHVHLLEGSGDRAWRHETLLVLAVRCPSRRGRPGKQGAEALRNEVRALRCQMHNLGIACDGPLDAKGAAVALGGFLVPVLDRHPGAHPGPLAVREAWAEVHVDGHWHRTYWVAEWPRSRVGPDFLSPLLTGLGRRSFSVVMAPVPPEKAAREAESSRTAHVADAQLRAQGGFLETARHRRRAEALEGREAELADGRGAFELAGYLTIAAADISELEQACSEMERAAGAARLCLRPLYGQQREALTWAQPFGRGL